jgi:hypothetical protein
VRWLGVPKAAVALFLIVPCWQLLTKGLLTPFVISNLTQVRADDGNSGTVFPN